MLIAINLIVFYHTGSLCVGEPLLSRLSSDSESPVSDDDYLEVYLLHVAILNGSLTPGSLPHSRFSFLKRRTVPGNIEGRGGGGELWTSTRSSFM